MAMEVPSAHRGGAAIFFRKAENVSVKELNLHVLNVTIFQLVTGRRRWHVVGCYISPIHASTKEEVAVAIRDRNYGAELLMTGKHNDNLAELEGTLPGEAIVDELAAVGLMEMGVNFLPWSKPWLEDSYMEHAEGWTRGPVPD